MPWWDKATRRWLFFAAIIFIYGSYRVSVNVLWRIGNERPIDWLSSLAVEMWDWTLWIAFTPLLLAFAKRFPLERPKLRRHLSAHLVGMVLFSFCHVYLWKGTEIALQQGISIFQLFLEGLNRLLMFTGMVNNFYKYAAIVGLYYAIDYFRKYRIRELEATQLKISAETLQRRLTEAKLDALRMQINPHFLFNTLNTISVLMEEDTDKANRMLVRLSDLLRMTLQYGQTNAIALETELSLVSTYLEIERIRFEDRLEIRIDNRTPGEKIQVPPLLMQPLAENAVLHGVAERIGKGVIQVLCRTENGNLILEIRDNGPGLSTVPPRENGIGLNNTRTRLQEIYGARAALEVWSTDEGTTAQIRMPLNQTLAGALP